MIGLFDRLARPLLGLLDAEDAHRLAMLSYLKSGQRAQALRQYRLCERILRAEFDAEPEAATRLLFDQLRLDPSSI